MSKKKLIIGLILVAITGVMITGVAIYLESICVTLKSLFTYIQAIGIVTTIPCFVCILTIIVNYMYDLVHKD